MESKQTLEEFEKENTEHEGMRIPGPGWLQQTQHSPNRTREIGETASQRRATALFEALAEQNKRRAARTKSDATLKNIDHENTKVTIGRYETWEVRMRRNNGRKKKNRAMSKGSRTRREILADHEMWSGKKSREVIIEQAKPHIEAIHIDGNPNIAEEDELGGLRECEAIIERWRWETCKTRTIAVPGMNAQTEEAAIEASEAVERLDDRGDGGITTGCGDHMKDESAGSLRSADIHVR